MAKNTISLLFLALSLIFFFFFFVQSQARLAPALYIFGDSTVDPGNNNNKFTLAKANFPPYGVDFPTGANGRFSNGLTIADFLALSLQIPIPPPFMGWEIGMTKNYRGFNYASASSGILSDTGSFEGWNLNLRRQVKFFRKTVLKYLPLHYKKEAKLARYLSKSIFLVVTGSNDYAMNYLRPLQYNSSRVYNPEQFADLLVNELGNHLLNLYKHGARKFVVFEIGPLGCLPATLAIAKPKTRCVEDLNALVSIFNNKLAVKINELTSTLKGTTFVGAKNFQLMYDLVQNPSNYGLKDSRNACCPGCMANEVPCKDRESRVFWDAVHPSEAAHKIAATKCFNGTGFCTPMNLHQLVRQH